LLSRGFGNWYKFFKYIKDKGRVVLAIDEFPFLIEASKAVPSIFQKGWDKGLKDSCIFLILIGSSIGMMETNVLGYKLPLFGSKIKPELDFFVSQTYEEVCQSYVRRYEG